MTKNEFVKDYCKRSGIAIDMLSLHNLVALPCNCGESKCAGWQMVAKENVEVHEDIYGLNEETQRG